MKATRIMAICTGLVLTLGSIAYAAPLVDLQDFGTQTPTTYFVDQDANKYNAPYYRWNGMDWGWSHNAITGTITSATLSVSAFDVDYYQGETDYIYAFDNGVKTLLGQLIGQNDAWAWTDFTLGSNFYDDISNGLQVWMEIDASDAGWAVALTKSALSIDGGIIPDPNPGNPVPEPSTMLLLGGGLAGLAFWRKRKQA